MVVDVAVSVTTKKVPVYTGVGGYYKMSLELAKISEEKNTEGYLMLPSYTFLVNKMD